MRQKNEDNKENLEANDQTKNDEAVNFQTEKASMNVVTEAKKFLSITSLQDHMNTTTQTDFIQYKRNNLQNFPIINGFIEEILQLGLRGNSAQTPNLNLFQKSISENINNVYYEKPISLVKNGTSSKAVNTTELNDK